MLKVSSSAALSELAGRKPAPAAAAVPAPAPAPAADLTQLVAMQAAMASMASNVAALANAVAASQPEPAPQRLRATIVRDAESRMSHVEVEIIRS